MSNSTSPTKDISLLDEKLNQLKSLANDVDNLLAELNRRIEPVLTPENVTAVPGESPGDNVPTQSPLANQLDLLISASAYQCSYLRDLIGRVEV